MNAVATGVNANGEFIKLLKQIKNAKHHTVSVGKGTKDEEKKENVVANIKIYEDWHAQVRKIAQDAGLELSEIKS